MAISINTTLNSQIEYWKGQKRFVSPNGEEYPSFREFTLNKIKPFSFSAFWAVKVVYGRGMNPSLRPSKGKNSKWGWGLFRRQNSPPKILNFCSMIFLWRFVGKEGRTLRTTTTNKNIRYSQFYKNQSLKKIRERVRSLKWIIQTSCIHYETV